jgi:hypothetical protein
MRAIKGPVFSGFKSSAPFLQPRFRLVSYPVGGIRIVLELIDLFNRPIRPFDLDCPTLTVTKYYEENWLCVHHGEAHIETIKTTPMPGLDWPLNGLPGLPDA